MMKIEVAKLCKNVREQVADYGVVLLPIALSFSYQTTLRLFGKQRINDECLTDFILFSQKFTHSLSSKFKMSLL